MPEEITFRQFCVNQLDRLSQFRQYGFMDDPARKDYRNFLERKCQTKPDVDRLMEEAILCAEMPTLAVLERIWAEQHPQTATVRPDCEWCAGTGFEIVERGPLSGAKRCRCGGVPAADPQLSYVGPGRAA